MAGKATSDKVDNKKRLLTALEKSFGVVTDACRNAKLSRETFYKYYNDDPIFKAAVDEMQEVALDFAETQLYKQIKDGIPTSTIFYLKTRGRKRGYIERTEHTGADGQPLVPGKIVIEIISDTPPVTNEEDIKDPTE